VPNPRFLSLLARFDNRGLFCRLVLECGGVAERLMAPHLKCGKVNAFGGSNPLPSAITFAQKCPVGHADTTNGRRAWE